MRIPCVATLPLLVAVNGVFVVPLAITVVQDVKAGALEVSQILHPPPPTRHISQVETVFNGPLLETGRGQTVVIFREAPLTWDQFMFLQANVVQLVKQQPNVLTLHGLLPQIVG